MNKLQLLSQISISGIPVIQLNFPNGGGIFANGLLSLTGTVLSIVFSLLIVVWVGYSLYAGYMIIRSQGETESIEKGVGIIKNIWITISVLIVFFIILTFAGSVFGFGSVYDWSQNLAQCGPNGPFFFQQVEQQTEFFNNNGVATKGAKVYCCPVPIDIELSLRTGSYTLRKGNDWVVFPTAAGTAGGISDVSVCQKTTYTLNN